MWCACEAIIPSKVNLFWRGVLTDGLCPMYVKHPETNDHILVTCKRSKLFWKTLSPSVDWSIDFNGSFINRCIILQGL